jgi:hypothetical protein
LADTITILRKTEGSAKLQTKIRRKKMPLCKDPLVNHLKSLGLNVVYPPRANLVPLELMLKQGKKLSRWGDATRAFESSVEIPTTMQNVTVNSIQTDIAAEHDLSIGLSVLGTIFGQVGAKLGLKATYKNAKKLKFTYEGIVSDYCDPLDIDRYLNSGKLDDSAISTQEYLESDSLYVVTEVFKSNKIRVEAQDETGAALEVEIPEIQQVGEANLKVTSENSQNSVLVYEGDTAITFGMRALKIDYVSKRDRAIFRLVKASTSLQGRSVGRSASLIDESTIYHSLDNDEEYMVF